MCQWIVRIGVSEERADKAQGLGDYEGRAPFIAFENIETYVSVTANIWMINSRGELKVRRFEWVILREENVQKKTPPSKGLFSGPSILAVHPLHTVQSKFTKIMDGSLKQTSQQVSNS